MSSSASDGQLQTLIQINLYRFRYGKFEYLLFKRNDKEDPFWQPVTEKVNTGSDIAATLKRAAAEQAGLHGFKHLDKELYTYEWFAGDERGRDVVFAAEIDAETAISTDDTDRYSEFAWLPFQEALLKLKWSGNKDALRELDDRLAARKISDPNYWRTTSNGLYSQSAPQNPADTAGTAPTQPAAAPNNRYANAPKRLPDQPLNGQQPDGKEVNTSEWFL